MALRRTKIIATLGPATDQPGVLEKVLLAGADVVRFNFSHGQPADHQIRASQVRNFAQQMGKEIGILADLQGPKIRIAKFTEGKVELKEDDQFILDADLANDAGTKQSVGIDYKELPQDVHPQDTLLLDDGRIVFIVENVRNNQIICRVKVGGFLSNNKGINRLGGGLSAKALTEKDIQDIKTAITIGVDYIALSFPRNAQDVLELKSHIDAANGENIGIVSKIERIEAIHNLDEIIQASDAIMVARGDLGVEIGDAELPAVQKDIIQRTRSLDKTCIVATQMMESMIYNSIPTRAEVFDVANAVLDGTDAVMLSAETATGSHPDHVVAAMSRICAGAEKQPGARRSGHRVECRFHRIDEAIAMATMYTANHLNIKGIIALTESGSTPLWMSRIRSGIPIFALTRFISTQRRMTLLRGVYPVAFDVTNVLRNDVNLRAVETIQQKGFVKQGDLVIITKGDTLGVHGGANAMKIVEVGSVI